MSVFSLCMFYCFSGLSVIENMHGAHREKHMLLIYIYKHLIKITQNQGAHSLYNLMFLCKQAWIVFGQVIDYCLFINPVQNCLFDCSAIFLVPWENSCSRRHVLFFLNIQDQKFICILVESLVSLKSHFFVLCVLLCEVFCFEVFLLDFFYLVHGRSQDVEVGPWNALTLDGHRQKSF